MYVGCGMCYGGDPSSDSLVGLFSTELKREKDEGKKCHTTTMRSRKTDKTIRLIPSMYRLDRTPRTKNKGRS